MAWAGDMTAGVAEERGRLRRVRRRPSGEPPPLPHQDHLGPVVWTFVAVLVLGIALNILVRTTDLISSVAQWTLAWFAAHRTQSLTDVAKAINLLTSFTAVMGLRVAAALVLILYKRFRLLVVFLATLVIADWVVVRLLWVALPAPSVKPLVDGAPYGFPSRAVSALAITLFSAAFVLAPRGKLRRSARWVILAALLLVVLADLYLAADYGVSMVYSAILALAIAGLAFGWLAPEESFPVSYRRGGTAAHLDLGGARGAAIVRAVADELGLTVTEVKPFGLEGSGGSSPLRMTLEDGSHVFGKIYSTSHARADRWYRIGRTILYGQLEDETPFGSVRRLVTYEDYALRFLDDNGVPVAHSYGIAELTPNKEYMLVTGFFENARNLGDSDIDDVVIDEGLRLVQRFWDVGVAHRDVKPANLLVREGHLQLVDVSGLEIRPSPWRQAVDLSNMMLTLALRADADRVYARATRVFTPDEIAEAFAASVGLAIPTELQAKMKADGRPLSARFRELAPARRPISIQRWSARRLAVTAVAALGVLVLAGLFLDSLRAGLT